MNISTRPDCPVCKKSSLTGELYKKYNDLMVNCENCGAKVFMTENWKIIRVEVHYRTDGEIIK